MKHLLPVILAGGVGSRLWPLSRKTHPKPFIKLDDGLSLIQKAYLRALELCPSKCVMTVTNRELFFYTKDSFVELDTSDVKHTFLLEPFGRNSAAAIASAAYQARREGGDDVVLLVMPADHIIDDATALYQAVERAYTLANEDKLVTFGMTPDSPNTAYGYIQANGNDVTKFVEKPNLKTAQQYLESGDFLWNSGMFCMKVGVFLNELERHAPDISKQAQLSLQYAECFQSNSWQQIEISAKYFESIRDISVDYAVFEKSEHMAVVPCDLGWSDIGSWNELGALKEADDSGNHVSGQSILRDVSNCVIHTDSRLVAGVGIDNLIIADTSDALLIAHKDRSQDVRYIVDELKKKGDACYESFPTVHRPWGTYTVLLEGEGFKLKRIEVKPGARLSLQSHRHRSEHWVVVSGIAQITNGEQILKLQANESTYIPIGNRHRLENLNTEQLILIEVQCGDYLGEDDIIRYDDCYGRVANTITEKA